MNGPYFILYTSLVSLFSAGVSFNESRSLNKIRIISTSVFSAKQCNNSMKNKLIGLEGKSCSKVHHI